MVTETEVTSDVAAEVGALIMIGLAKGDTLGRALHQARWYHFRKTRSLASMAYTSYGPAGVRLRWPVPGRY